MAIIKAYQNGLISAKYQGRRSLPPPRENTKGWTLNVSRRLRKWLYSVPLDSMTGLGFAFTLTVRDCPATAKNWSDLRDRFLTLLFRSGCIRAHWLTEWQKRGVPHLHGVAYWADDDERRKRALAVIQEGWLRLAKKYGAGSRGQNVKLVDDTKGWLEYLSKHAARGVTHYQRSSDLIPEGWKESTGRMWGYRGQWEVREPMTFYIDDEGFYRYRRIAAKWWKARQQQLELEAVKRLMRGKPFRVISFTKFRNKLKCNDPVQSRYMGTSDWIDLDTSTKILVWLGSQGHKIEQR